MYNPSKLVFFSLGIVAQDKVKDDLEIYVWPIELSPTMTGDIMENIPLTADIKDANGEITSLSIKKRKYIKAAWLPDGVSNRATPPDVTQGMTVRLFNYAGTQDYYWNTLYNEIDLAKQEKVLYFFSNKKELIKPMDPQLMDKGYTFTVDTYDKYIKLHTDNNDGEACTYDIEVDAANGVLTIKDDLENSIELKSQDGKLTVNLKEEYVLNTKKTTSNITDGVTFTTEKDVELTLDKISIKNENGELIDLLVQLINAMMEEQHLGNMGAPTSLMAASVQKYQEILQKLETFKK